MLNALPRNTFYAGLGHDELAACRGSQPKLGYHHLAMFHRVTCLHKAGSGLGLWNGLLHGIRKGEQHRIHIMTEIQIMHGRQAGL